MPGKDHTDYFYVKFSAYALLGGEQIDIAGMTVTYGLDSIPTAEIYPTVGREPRNNIEARAVEKLLAAQPFTTLSLYAKFETDNDSPSDLPGFPYNKDVLLFDGYISGVTYDTSRNPAGGWVSVKASAMGWLTALRGTTAQTSKSTVKGPGGFAEAANLNNKKLMLFNIKQAFAADGVGVTTNIWKEFVKEFFFELMDSPSVWGDSPNDSAYAALERMDDESVFSGSASNELPITLGELAGNATEVAEFFGQDIGNHIYKLWRDANLWDALMSIAEDFKFSVVPLIKTASCVPAYPALNGEPHRYITTSDYHTINLTANTPMKIVKVVLTGNMQSSPFAVSMVPGAVVGLHSAEDAWSDPEIGAKGQTLALPAPPWLVAATPIGRLTRGSLGQNKLLIPDADNPTANVETPDADYQQIYGNLVTSELGDLLAKAMCQPLLFAERFGTVDGRFRLDIAPASIVRIQVIDDKFAEKGVPEKSVYGQVQTVTLELNAGKDGSTGTAGTKLFVKYLRTEAEHELPGPALTSPDHPLYGERFTGVELWTE